ncbi:assimilatory sulfite reductase (NADPH) hemoprotein subunit [Sphingomonas sp. SM33]|uniref:Sulfite reductase [NADPH] hemoprotein beta-component n=1 Tax=Sphingomonas telluris TaxID=2907998 RepID=A0ABS9VMB0_9SPHN|nr:assimilatory sulfite reductase (NADPH) hemoprotein subunit [Sphingomonas telluris]MCH8616092.1 assimilatory sulfite reductase (NADPH) hemoprotein subunit [Sphingomonas telluris]
MTTRTIDRSTDLSQSLDKLGPDETLKHNSDYLRGHIASDLLDRITGGVTFESNKLMKFHGIYQQDDRDIRDERRRQKLEPALTFMVRVRLPGGVCTPEQWLKIDELAQAHGGNTIRLTTRQTFQFHWIVKEDIKPTIEGLHDVLLDTIAACGDDSRGVMATADPADSDVHAEVAALSKQLSDHVIPKTRAYHEIWYGEERVATSENEEPFYGKQYLPRKFKIGFVVPPSNDIDVYTQDLGFIAITGPNGIEGFNVTIGGGMGRTDNEPTTYPRLADVVGFIPEDRLLACADAVMSVQRDYGNRLIRARARFKYTIDDKGLDFIKAEIEQRMGAPFEPARPFELTTNGDGFGWRQTDRGTWNYGLFIANGRVSDLPGRDIMSGLREIAKVLKGHFRLTPNQNLIIAGVAPEDKAQIEALLDAHGLSANARTSALRLNSIACVALPTCPLAMAEAERYLPDLITKIEGILDRNGLAEEPITIRMSGCPNGCSRPYVAEIALTGRAPGKYNLYLGGGFHGERLNALYAENLGEERILEILSEKLSAYARDRAPGERFGDFVTRTIDRPQAA